MKKILSLFALLMAIVTGANAQTTIFEYTVAEGDAPDNATAATGTVELGAAKVEQNSNVPGVYAFKSDGQPQADKNSTKYVKAVPTQALQAGDVISVNMFATSNPDGTNYGVALYSENEAGATPVTTLYLGAKIKNTPTTYSYTVQEGDALVGAEEIYLFRATDKSTYIVSVKIESSGAPTPAGGATIDTQPQDAEYVNGTTDYPNLSVGATADAGEITYEWFVEWNSVWTSLVDLNIPTANQATLSGKMAIEVLEAIIPGGVIPAGDYSFKCKVTNEGVDKWTNVAKITVRNKSEKCQLISIKFSNSAYGSIDEPTPAGEDAEANPIEAKDGKITVPYMAGEEEPLLIVDMVEVSEGATWELSDGVMVVTAEDGTTQALYDIVYQAITPLTVTADVAADFTTDGETEPVVPSWIYNPYGIDNDKGLKFAKAENSEATDTKPANYRISKGNTRQYYFIGAAESLTLNATGSNTKRNVNVYVNGEKVQSNVENGKIDEIMLSTEGNNMVCIESAQTGGDGGFGSYSIKAAATAEIPSVTLNNDGFATFSFTKAVKVAEGTTAKAYYASGLQGNKLVLKDTSTIPAEQGAIIYGAPGTVVNFVESDEEIQLSNLLRPTTTANGLVEVPSTSDATFVSNALTLDGSTFKTYALKVFKPNKAYILKSDIANDTKSLEIVFDGQATAVDAVAEAAEAEAAPVKVIKGGKLYIGNYNIAGQQVK